VPIEANPGATQNDAATYMAGVASPFDLATLQIVDRVGALQWFIAQTGASWTQVKSFLINNPVGALKKYEPGEGKDLDISGEKAKILRVVGVSEPDTAETWGDIGFAAEVLEQVWRDPTPGPTQNFIIRKEWTGTIDGAPVTVMQIFTNTFDGQRVRTSAGPLQIKP